MLINSDLGLTRSPPGSGDSGSSLEVTRNSSRRSSRALIDDFTYYPAILSQVAYVFRKLVPTASRYKDSLEYTDCFIGRDAVDILSTIIKSSDRNLCLLLGRALDAQGFFHDVTYNHRLRDSPNELYKFQTEQLLIADSTDEKDAGSPAKGVKDETLPNGVFTLLTHCYSPTCSADKLCYSIACPGRLEQQSRLLKQATSRSNLERSPSRTSFGDQEKQAELLWSTTVPQDIVDAVSSAERKRQEIIYEAIQTEKEFVGDLELIENVFIQPLRKKLIIPAERLESFISSVFLNISELHEINSQLLQKLLERQKANHIVDKIGDIFLATVPSFQAYVRYGAQQVFAKHILDQERATNPEFAKFLQECERDPQCRKLPIHSFLARPTTRIGRYPLFLQSAIKAAAEHHPDRTLIPQAIRVIKAVLMDINQEAGRSEDMLKLQRLQDSLIFPGEPYDLGLAKPGRAIIREGTLMLRRNGHDQEIHLYLFDHVLLMTKTKKGGSRKLYKRPIPLELIVVADTQSSVGRRGSIRSLPNSVHNSVHSSISSKSSHHTTITPLSDASKGFPLTITHLGRDGGTVTFHASNQAERRLWREAIESQKSLLMESKQKFEIVTLLDTLFPYHNRVNASTVLGDRLILGTDAGLYVGPLHCEDGAGEQSFKKVLDMEKISQVDVLPDHDLLTLLAEKCLWSFPLSILDSPESESGKYFHKGERVSSSTNFFKSGVCSDRTLISGVRVTALSSIVKIYEPISGESKKRGKLGKLFSSAEQTVKTFKEFYIPAEANSIHYLRTKLCVGCSKGFEIVDLDTLMPQGLIDPDDDKLDFVSKREGLKPISIFRLDGGDFLLCYDEFGFYINRFGARIKEDSLIYWLGNPTSFAFHAPYIIAFEPSFIEVRHVGTGELQQIIPTHNMRTLNTNPEILHCVMDSPLEYQCVFRLREVVSTTAAVMDELFDDEEVGDGEGEGVDDGGSVA
ncbi:CNH domain-containing protein [Fimicolochytrium jonesii]|uniref:CNH domain-containing protein n=1 Tax=Fimicolochytrium jonesii TaxID=1396493 RepID=UPI0022FED6E1|nr:CNH domain-containing protein [Fimicolochytrium jonesii]KAI8824483.1 CNH domain-containing protein [Fimicolochytrium jonesii]